MRSFRDSLEQSNIRNIYYDFNNSFNDPFIEKLAEEIKKNQFFQQLIFFSKSGYLLSRWIDKLQKFI